MNIYLKPAILAVVLMTTELSSPASAEPTLFNFTLTVKEIPEPKIFVGRDMKQPHESKNATFHVKARPSDYFFKVHFKHQGKNKEAICPISGTPALITATINPEKDGRDACTTQESGRG